MLVLKKILYKKYVLLIEGLNPKVAKGKKFFSYLELSQDLANEISNSPQPWNYVDINLEKNSILLKPEM